jgi:hypothetical protein
MRPRLLFLLSALRAHRALRLDRDRVDARLAAARTSIGLPRIAPHRHVTLTLNRLRDHTAREERARAREALTVVGR